MYSAASAIPFYARERSALTTAPTGLEVTSSAHDDALPGHDSLQSAVQTLATLMHAKAITLLSRSTESGIVRTALSSEPGSDRANFVPDDGAPYLPIGEAQWLRHDGEPVLLAKLSQDRDSSLWAVITFAVDPAYVSPSLEMQMPCYLALLASQAAALSALGEAQVRHHAIASALDQQDSGIFILGFDHEIVYANRAAHVLLERRTGLHLSRAKLRPLGYKEAVRFETAIDCVIDAQQAGGKGRSKAMLLLLPIDEGITRIAVTIAPACDHPLGLLSGRAAAIISVEPADDRMNRGIESICEAYQLSPVEVQLVCHLAAGLSVGDAASRMRVKVDTARAYLKQVFVKTGTHRQAALLQLVTRHQRVIQGNHIFAVA